MQEVRDEMTRRVAAINRRNEWLYEQREEHAAELTKITRELEDNNKLATQYRQLINGIPLDEPPARAVRA